MPELYAASPAQFWEFGVAGGLYGFLRPKFGSLEMPEFHTASPTQIWDFGGAVVLYKFLRPKFRIFFYAASSLELWGLCSFSLSSLTNIAAYGMYVSGTHVSGTHVSGTPVSGIHDSGIQVSKFFTFG